MYGPEDYAFDAEAQGRCPLCGRETCNHCRDCGADCDPKTGACSWCEQAEQEAADAELTELGL